MTQELQQSARPVEYRRFERPTPAWYTDAKLGIFIHWGAYSVPAWAEPIGPLGAFDHAWWNAHNPYAEWYYNTIRIDGSPAQRHQLDTYGSLDYEQFLDLWRAEEFDAGALMELVKAAGRATSCRPPSITTASRCGTRPARAAATPSAVGRVAT